MSDSKPTAPNFVIESGHTGSISNPYTRTETDAKFKDVNYVVLTVVVILLVMVATLIIDSFHFNSATYQEYSEKLRALHDLQETNSQLLIQNKQYQEVIIEQQKTLKGLLQK